MQEMVGLIALPNTQAFHHCAITPGVKSIMRFKRPARADYNNIEIINNQSPYLHEINQQRLK